MRASGFTLLELVIVLALLGITALFGSRFIAESALLYQGTRERAETLNGGRFALERLRRELGMAYGPSIHLSEEGDGCLYFVPVLAAGKYQGDPRPGAENITLILPVPLRDTTLAGMNIAIMAGSAGWADYPGALPEGVNPLPDGDYGDTAGFRNEDWPAGWVFPVTGPARRYSLLHPRLVRYCLREGGLYRNLDAGEGFTPGGERLMLDGLAPASQIRPADYDAALQLLALELVLETRDGALVLPQRIRVGYAQ